MCSKYIVKLQTAYSKRELPSQVEIILQVIFLLDLKYKMITTDLLTCLENSDILKSNILMKNLDEEGSKTHC